MRAKYFSTLCVLTCCCVLQLRAGPPTTQPVRIATTQAVQNLHGETVTPLKVPASDRAVLLVFIASDCPISNTYAPTIAKLCQTFAPKGIDCFTVYCDASLTPSAAQAHHDQFGFPCDALLDPKQQLASFVGATRTPEAVVIGEGGLIIYRGRIDDLYAALGRKRFAATTHELQEVLNDIVAAQPVTVPWLPAIGCEIN